jgi:hypothetical protein
MNHFRRVLTYLGLLVGIFALLTLIISIIRVPPNDWQNSIQEWMKLIFSIGGLVVIILLLIFIIIFLLYKGKASSISKPIPQSEIQNTNQNKSDIYEPIPKLDSLYIEPSRVEIFPYNSDDFHHIFRKMMKENISELCIFGYTSETLSDYINYQDRYENFTLRLLLRDWNVEREDEETYNASLAPGIRKWLKWENLKLEAHKWSKASDNNFNYNIELRFYTEKPTFKGIIVKFKDSHVEVYLGLYEYVEHPNGGSQYKGDKGSVVHLSSKSNDLERILLERTTSQFNRIWKDGKTITDVESDEIKLKRNVL